MTSPSKRDVERDLEDLKEHTTESPPTVILETEAGNYYDSNGNQIEDLPNNVPFVVPPGVWQMWCSDDAEIEFTPPPE